MLFQFSGIFKHHYGTGSPFKKKKKKKMFQSLMISEPSINWSIQRKQCCRLVRDFQVFCWICSPPKTGTQLLRFEHLCSVVFLTTEVISWHKNPKNLSEPRHKKISFNVIIPGHPNTSWERVKGMFWGPSQEGGVWMFKSPHNGLVFLP